MQADASAPRQLALVATIGPTCAASARASARSAYLLVYFKDETHSLHFATSPDGYTFTDVNGGEPVLSGRAVADQKGLRDPHIMRGPDGSFYMSMTDLHIYAQREGLRATLWERPETQFGWGNNRNLLLMKSNDLLHWTLAKVAVASLFPAYANASSAWAPETIWDPATRRMMVYFTTRMGNGPNFMVYSYADRAFTTLTTEPKRILDYPRPGVDVIDGDVTKIGREYHMFYVAHEKPGSIRQAVSSRINGGYVHDPRKVDPESVAAEAPTLWRRHGTNTYVLMYDVFGAKPNNMGFAETTDFRTFRNIGRFNEAGSKMKSTNFTAPKHGAVMAITPEEADRLHRYFAR
ncbi:beta-xylosidase [Sphingomonas melonis]|uniref:Beta-xylosidase n=1 Tax=Sphingomonas melonis TaxID=152682 RepID=A0A0D1M2A0_9SPHN|nr:beta-xylosidase [Sphingomonas melonis]